MGTRERGKDDRASVTAVLHLEPQTNAAALARRFVEEHRDHLDAQIVDNAQLLVSEIVTNAVRHGTGEITLTLRLDPPGIGVAVTDTSDQLPVVRDGFPPEDQPSGRGMIIVDAVASEWGVSPRWPPPGKTVWFDVRPESEAVDP